MLAALNGQAGDLFQRIQLEGLATAIFALGGISVILWFAMYALVKVGFEDRGGYLGRVDLAILAVTILLTIGPSSTAARGALLLCAVYLFITSRRDQSDRRVAYLLIALTGPLIWGPILLALAPQPLLSFDAHLVGLLIGTPARGNVFGVTSGNNQVVIGTECSSVHNISLALVLWTTAAVLFKVRIDARWIAVGLAMVALMFSINIARIAAIGMFPQHYEFLHTGAGGAVFAWAGLLGSGFFTAVGVLRARAHS